MFTLNCERYLLAIIKGVSWSQLYWNSMQHIKVRLRNKVSLLKVNCICRRVGAWKERRRRWWASRERAVKWPKRYLSHPKGTIQKEVRWVDLFSSRQTTLPSPSNPVPKFSTMTSLSARPSRRLWIGSCYSLVTFGCVLFRFVLDELCRKVIEQFLRSRPDIIKCTPVFDGKKNVYTARRIEGLNSQVSTFVIN